VKKLPLDAEAVVFDCDGLLVDTEACWTRAETALFAAHGLAFGPRQKALLIGRTMEAASAIMAGYFGRPGAGAEVAAELLGLVRAELATGAGPLPGALDLIRTLTGRVPMAVASNSPRELLDLALKSAGLAGFFEHTFAVDEVEQGKPAPDLYLAACERLGAAPGRCVAFEDSATGIAAARAAGMFLAVVPSLADRELDHDWLGASLADSEVTAWSAAIGHGPSISSRPASSGVAGTR
jgi:HAD superfamily hydrolase (TIGR01509 family)